MLKGQEGEDFVNKIAYTSFLKYWCFPGPLDITGDNKEICDLIILFKQTLILVSVKNYSFDRDHYERYFKKTVAKAIKQINGAERKLFGNRPILLKHPDRSPVEFDKNKISKIYRIIVNLNNDVKYYQTSIYEKDQNIFVMDSDAWLGAITELNTIPDFTNYLEQRGNLFGRFPAFILPRQELDFDSRDAISFMNEVQSKVIDIDSKFSTILGSELDLIAVYIKNGFQFPEELNHNNSNALSLMIDGEWNRYIESKIAQTKNDLEKEGYFIEYLIKEVLKEEKSGIVIAEMLFNLNRFQRTLFANHFIEYYNGVINDSAKISWNRTHYVGLDLNFVFICFDNSITKEKLDEIVSVSILHHAYLHDFNLENIGVIGVSKDFQNYLLASGQGNEKLGSQEIQELEMGFKELGWMIK